MADSNLAVELVGHLVADGEAAVAKVVPVALPVQNLEPHVLGIHNLAANVLHHISVAHELAAVIVVVDVGRTDDESIGDDLRLDVGHDVKM